LDSGGEEIFHTLPKSPLAIHGAISNQLTHPDWHGFHFYDLIFPLSILRGSCNTLLGGTRTGKRQDSATTTSPVIRRADPGGSGGHL